MNYCSAKLVRYKSRLWWWDGAMTYDDLLLLWSIRDSSCGEAAPINLCRVLTDAEAKPQLDAIAYFKNQGALV